ncbi:hypothetical protein PR048_007228 [Dryococelus australis]|uniref:Uncharacterized protein n=1 Tax=Dryococelus australis TaxID=614101 RepID=A0ABQ9IEB9_9NEOP|nr:hypothetical protein PR048_007228 [Dryococelus australis]
MRFSSKEFIHEDLNISKIYNMCLNDIQTGESKGSLEMYRQVFQLINLPFIRPNEDQCSLCMSYPEGTVEAKQILEETFTIYNQRKDKTREINDQAKQRAMRNLMNWTPNTVALFADSCGGQNKNTIAAALLLYVVHHGSSLEEIASNFCEPNHAQSEGDSAFSAIAHAQVISLYNLNLSQSFVWLGERNYTLCMIRNLLTSLTSSNSQKTCTCILLNLSMEPTKQLSGRKLQN